VGASRGAGHGGPQLAHQYGASPASGRSVSPTTDRSRSRSPSACSTSSGYSEQMSLGSHPVQLAHLPAGRFVYGRRYLQAGPAFTSNNGAPAYIS
jgi:hypothetical protein